MGTVSDHYSELLAPIYLWMVGGPDAAFSQGAAELSALKISPSNGAHALDLGAGFGMHAIPLARLGYAVTAIDSSAELLSQLRRLASGLDIHTVESDLLGFAEWPAVQPEWILCMGDTLTHLSSVDDVEHLCSRVADCLAPAGCFVTTFRDYSRPLQGDARFIPVRADVDRIHTCFLEQQAEHMLVHDIVHERQGETWTTRVSHYPKLRLDPDRVVAALEQCGLIALRSTGPRGMVQIAAMRRSV